MLVNPVFEAPTAEMRAVLPASVPMASAIRNCAMGGSLVDNFSQTCYLLSYSLCLYLLMPGLRPLHTSLVSTTGLPDCVW